MSFSLVRNTSGGTSNAYCTSAYMLMIETHLSWLRSLPSTLSVVVAPGDAYKFEGDFTGLLFMMGVPSSRHHVLMRLNGLRSPLDYLSTMNTLVVPDYSVLDRLDQIYFTTTTPYGS